MATIQLPSLFRRFTEQQEKLVISGETLFDILNALVSIYPALYPYLFDEKRQICNFINVYVNGNDIRFLANEKTPIKNTDVLTIIPAIAGG